MPRLSPYRIDLTDHDQERVVLESLARSYTLPYWQVTRAQIVLMAADGLRNDQIAKRLRCGRDVVSQWRKRFRRAAPRWRTGPGAADRRLLPPQVRAEVIRPACEPPADSELPLARWSSAELAAEAVTRGSASRQWGNGVALASEDAIKPSQNRSSSFPATHSHRQGRVHNLRRSLQLSLRQSSRSEPFYSARHEPRARALQPAELGRRDRSDYGLLQGQRRMPAGSCGHTVS